MGSVALAAGITLIEALRMQPAEELSPSEWFEVQQIEVRDGIISLGRLPRSRFFVWRSPSHAGDLVLFLGEAQPEARGYDYCRKVLDHAAAMGADRVCTFAAMATQVLADEPPRVHGAATDPGAREWLSRHDVEVLDEGQIGGLNGILLAAAAERGLRGICLLGQMPFFAAQVANPTASLAVLRAFARITGIAPDLAELAGRAEVFGAKLKEILAQLERTATEKDAEEGAALAETEPSGEAEGGPDLEARERIEALFEQARQDRSKAYELKRELDRLGVFRRYEDRFLDIFKKAE
jgi:proteasome assembly chaperone (PAC2) family protein